MTTKKQLKSKIQSYRGGPGSGRKPGSKNKNSGQHSNYEAIESLHNAILDDKIGQKTPDQYLSMGQQVPRTHYSNQSFEGEHPFSAAELTAIAGRPMTKQGRGWFHPKGGVSSGYGNLDTGRLAEKFDHLGYQLYTHGSRDGDGYNFTIVPKNKPAPYSGPEERTFKPDPVEDWGPKTWPAQEEWNKQYRG